MVCSFKQPAFTELLCKWKGYHQSCPFISAWTVSATSLSYALLRVVSSIDLRCLLWPLYDSISFSLLAPRVETVRHGTKGHKERYSLQVEWLKSEQDHPRYHATMMERCSECHFI